MSRPYTKEEVVDKFLNLLYAMKIEWANNDSDRTVEEKMEGLIFSILALFDGDSVPELPRLEISLRPEEDHMSYCQQEDEDYFEMGQVFNTDHSLHGCWCKLRNNKNGEIK